MLEHFKRKTYFAILILLTSYVVLGQEATLTGKVIDNEDLEPLIGVNIFSENNIGAITNMNGEYKINLPPGKHKVTFQFIGYQVQQMLLNFMN